MRELSQRRCKYAAGDNSTGFISRLDDTDAGGLPQVRDMEGGGGGGGGTIYKAVHAASARLSSPNVLAEVSVVDRRRGATCASESAMPWIGPSILRSCAQYDRATTTLRQWPAR